MCQLVQRNFEYRVWGMKKIIKFWEKSFFFAFLAWVQALTLFIDLHNRNTYLRIIRIIHITNLNVERIPIAYYLRVDLVPILGSNRHLISVEFYVKWGCTRLWGLHLFKSHHLAIYLLFRDKMQQQGLVILWRNFEKNHLN